MIVNALEEYFGTKLSEYGPNKVQKSSIKSNLSLGDRIDSLLRNKIIDEQDAKDLKIVLGTATANGMKALIKEIEELERQAEGEPTPEKHEMTPSGKTIPT
jgi:hypothetical protein